MNKLLAGIFLFTFCSCEKTIEIRSEVKDALIVIDAQIENGQPPIVQLTNTINYFSNISKEVLSRVFLHDAKITISDGVSSHQLKEFAIPIGEGYHIYYYGLDSSRLNTAIIGKFSQRYSLKVEVNNIAYTAETTIPELDKTIEKLWWLPAPKNDDTTKVLLMAQVYDPPGYGDYIRYFTKVNRGNFLPGFTSAFDDQVTDGKSYEIQVDQGVDRNNRPKSEDYGFFKKGDTATVKFCNIDKATYDFWRTIEFGYQSVGNPFSSPIKVIGNISNGALGAFCGYAVQYNTLIIPK